MPLMTLPLWRISVGIQALSVLLNSPVCDCNHLTTES